VAALPPKKFKADDGVALVDQWVAARSKRRRLEEEAAVITVQEEELQAQLIAFASQQRVESVAGSSHHVDVVEQQVVSCPGADDENREAFEKAIRRAGIWDDVTSPNLNRFKAIWKSVDIQAMLAAVAVPRHSAESLLQYHWCDRI
jgi:hypothetical protein